MTHCGNFCPAAVGLSLQADATVALLGGRDGWVPTHNLTALLLLAVPGTLHSKIGLMFRLLDRWALGNFHNDRFVKTLLPSAPCANRTGAGPNALFVSLTGARL
jgi:hypothetical protein